MTCRGLLLLALTLSLSAPACVIVVDDGASASGTGGASSTGDGSATAGSTGDGSATGTGGATTEEVTTGAGSTGTIDPGAFDSFRVYFAAGPCPLEEDCEGFTELLADKTLRVDKFGGISVAEVVISDADFDAARLVFADAGLVALLDGPQPVCDPPTDIFESMEVVLSGTSHQNSTTLCDQAPIAAARDMADSLQQKYVP